MSPFARSPVRGRVAGELGWKLRILGGLVLVIAATVPLLEAAFVFAVMDGAPSGAVRGVIERSSALWPLLVLACLPLLRELDLAPGFFRTGSIVTIGVLLVLVQGVWTAVTTPLCACTMRERSYRAAPRADLHNVASQQEIFLAYEGRYSESFDSLGFITSQGVAVELAASGSGWTARSTHQALSDYACAIYQGSVGQPFSIRSGVVPARPDRVICDPQPFAIDREAFSDWVLRRYDRLEQRW